MLVDYWRFIFISVLFLTFIYFALRIFLNLPFEKDKIAVAISIIALVISICGVFKNEIFTFKLRICAKDWMMPATAGSSPENFILTLPIQFVNKGYGEGFVEDIVLLISGEKDKQIKYYIPLFEIDMRKFMQEKRSLHVKNIEKVFSGFSSKGKETVAKTIVFKQAKNNKEYPLSKWQTDKYNIDIYIKIAKSSKYKRYTTIPANITQKIFDNWKNRISVYSFGKRDFER